MRYRILPPHSHLILDALFAAVLLTILGLTSSLFIQVLVDSVFVLGHTPTLNWLGLGTLLDTPARAWLPCSGISPIAHLSRRIGAETVLSCHRHLPGLPLIFLSSNGSRTLAVAAALIAAEGGSAYFKSFDVVAPVPPNLAPRGGAIPIVTDVGGRIQKVYVAEGSAVHLGDPIVQLDTSGLMLHQHAIESRIHRLERQPARAHGELSSLYRELEQTQLSLSCFTITSPADGQIIGLRALYPGTMLVAGTAIAVAVPRKNVSD